MAKWQQIKIGDICIVERGGSPRPIDKFITEDENGINWIKIGDTTESMYITRTAQKIIPEGAKKSRVVQAGDFLLSNSMSFGRPYILSIDGCIHDGWLVLRDQNNAFDKHYLYYCLSAPTTYIKFKSMAVGGVVNNLNSEMVRNVEIPLAPLDEQRKIAAVLDKVSDLIAKRRQQLDKLDEMVKARFVEMFGDPVYNSKRLPTEQGMNFFKLSNGKFLPESKRFTSGIPAYGGNGISWYTDESMISNDTLVVGRVGFQSGNVRFVKGPLWITDNAMYVSDYDTQKYNLLFLCALMEHINFTRFQDAGDLKKITQKPFMNMEYISPSLQEQHKYVFFVKQTKKTKNTISRSLERLETLKKALMQEYFG